jgi:prepilin-type N-terminal cleavage/methylation domain-containing protein
MHARTTKQSHRAFTLVEIMIVVAIIALLAAIAVPAFIRARKRSEASLVLNDLRLIDAAVSQYAIETQKATGDAVYVSDWVDYVKQDTRLADSGTDIFGNDYGDQNVDEIATVPAATWDALSDVLDPSFWTPYVRETIPKGRHKKPPHPHHP